MHFYLLWQKFTMTSFVRSAVASELKPLLGFLLLLLVWLYPFSAGSSPDALQQLVALAALAMAALLFGMHPIHRLVVIVAAFFVLAIALSPSEYVGPQLAGICGITLVVLGGGVGAQLQRSSTALTWLLFGVVVAAFVNALEGLLQWFGLADELWPWVIDTGRRGLAYGAFRQTNLFATFLCIGVVCTTWLVYLRCLSSSMALFLVCIMTFGIAASGSRTGGLELMAMCFAGMIWRKQQTIEVTRLLVGSVFVFGIAMYVLPIAADLHGFGFASASERLATANTDARLVIWQNATLLIAERPWTGWGWMGVGFGHYTTLFEHRFNQLLDHAHNLPLQLAVEFGLPFTLAFVAVLIWAIYKGKPWQVIYQNQTAQHEPPINRSFAWIILLLLVGIHSMLEKPLWYFGFLFLTGFCCGYLHIFSNEESSKDQSGVLSSIAYKACASILIVLTLIAWQQYKNILEIYKAPFNDQSAQQIAINNASDAWLFQSHLDFVKFEITDVTSKNAQDIKLTAAKLLHFSAEPLVIQKLLLGLWYLHEKDALQFHAIRFCRAFPSEFNQWINNHKYSPIFQDLSFLDKKCQLSDILFKSQSENTI